MKVIDPSFEIQDELDRQPLVVRLEQCGRICYKSEDKISADSAMPFVKNIAAHGHNSVLEMAVQTLLIECSKEQLQDFYGCQPKYFMIDEYDGRLLVTGSIRAFREVYRRCPEIDIVRGSLRFLGQKHPYLFEKIWDASHPLPKEDIGVRKLELTEVEKLPEALLLRHRYVGVKFFVNRAVTHELVRHRTCSFLQESQRYCRYSQDKFENQVTFIRPMFYQEGTEEYALWVQAMEQTESLYLKLLESSTPQAARTVLPNSCKTEIIVYCNLEEWQHIFALRTHATAEPSMREIMVPLSEEIIKRYPIKL